MGIYRLRFQKSDAAHDEIRQMKCKEKGEYLNSHQLEPAPEGLGLNDRELQTPVPSSFSLLPRTFLSPLEPFLH